MQPIPPLNQILGTIPWVLVGGLALRAYIPERMTLDVDILIHERDDQRTRAAFLAAHYRVIGHVSIGGFSVQSQTATNPIGIRTRADPWLAAALAAPSYDSAGYPVLARDYLLLLKLQAGRAQDLADVQRLLAFTTPSERTTLAQLITQESPELREDFASLCTLADLEFGTNLNI